MVKRIWSPIHDRWIERPIREVPKPEDQPRKRQSRLRPQPVAEPVQETMVDAALITQDEQPMEPVTENADAEVPSEVG